MANEDIYYRSPLVMRYCSNEMLFEFSARNKYELWRNLWIWLAESQHSLGLEISQDQISEMKLNNKIIDIRATQTEERRTYNEVIAHLNVFREQCPKAAPIIHLGVTGFYITDNADLIIFKKALNLLLPRLASIIHHLKSFAETHKDLPILAFKQLQPTLLTTVGKRTCLWISDLLMDERALQRCHDDLCFLGVKGIVGTQLNALDLFKGDVEKVKKLDIRVAQLAGFSKTYSITGQTYSRKVDVELLGALASLGSSIHKICSDLRILAFQKVIEEPFTRSTYKRYPIKCERLCSLSRYITSIYTCAIHTHSNQWLEGTMDDSACRRLSMPEAFLCADAALLLFIKIVKGLVIHPKIIEKQVNQELPFMTVDQIVKAMVKTGADSVDCKKRIGDIVTWISDEYKEYGREHNLYNRIKDDEYFAPIHEHLDRIFSASSYIGRACQQVTEFTAQEVNPVLFPYGDVVMLY